MSPLTYLVALLVCLSATSGQRVAPGVPPQQYQQVPQHHPQQQYQQVPVQHIPVDQYGQPIQQVPQQQVQYQQAGAVPQVVPQQQVHHQQQQVYQQQQQPQQVHPQHQQQPQQVPHGGHAAPHGHAPHGQQPVLNPANIQHEREHIAEHMDVPIDTSKMSDQELQFHYFKMHDSDNNNKLDGCELIKSLIHWHEQGSKDSHDHGKPKVEEKVFSDDELVALIDPILQMDDTSRDGYIDYPEFIKAQKKASQNQQNRPT